MIIATLAQSCIRNSDIAARWGGEEFAVMLPHTALEGAVITAEKIRATIEAADFGAVGSITSSFGVALLQEKEDQEPFFDRADKALYLAKASGRNGTKTG